MKFNHSLRQGLLITLILQVGAFAFADNGITLNCHNDSNGSTLKVTAPDVFKYEDSRGVGEYFGKPITNQAVNSESLVLGCEIENHGSHFKPDPEFRNPTIVCGHGLISSYTPRITIYKSEKQQDKFTAKVESLPTWGQDPIFVTEMTCEK